MIDSLGSRILQRRESLHLSQTDLGKLCGVSRTSVCGWERDVSVPRKKMLEKLAAALQTSVEELVTFSGSDASASPALKNIKDKFGEDALSEVNDLYLRTAGLFAGGTLSQKAKDAYFAAITQAYLDCRMASENENTEKEKSVE